MGCELLGEACTRIVDLLWRHDKKLNRGEAKSHWM